MDDGRDRIDVTRLEGAELTYPEHGATRGVMPSGYRHVRRRELLGTGRASFDRVARTLLSWDMHRRAGLGVTASAASATTGTTVVLTVGWRRLRVTAPCRVVYTVDQPDRRGFAYGTLTGHPERGEEAFVLELTSADEVWIDIRAFSRPAWWLARASGPVNRIVQDAITDRSVKALRR